MDEKTELADTPPEIVETVDSSLEEDISAEPTAVLTADIGTTEEEAGIGEDAGVSEVVEDAPDLQTNIEHSDATNDTNTLISELNDVTLTTTASAETDSFLESLTSETVTVEEPIPDEQSENTVVDSDISMPSLILSEEATPTSPPPPPLQQEISLEEKEETDVSKEIVEEEIKEDNEEKEQKDPVCTLEEELERMHEEDPMTLNSVTNVKTEQDNFNLDQKPKIEENNVMKNQTPIMKDSDLEEMLAADEVLQDPVTIKKSQEELKSADILVCGNCHEVFSFLEEFQDHKAHTCSEISKVLPNCTFEGKPQVWAYALWKNKQIKLADKNMLQSQWELYKKWCALTEADKDVWLRAGQTLQYCHKLGTAKLTEIKVNENNINKAVRTMQSKEEKSEYAVERIVAKRFNPKKKTWEYQIKWEHFSSDDNTWEPLSNLNHCKQLVDEFEDQLKKLKAEKAKQQVMSLAAKSSPKARPLTAVHSPIISTNASNTGATPNRPQRTSKQKALDQVKAWCGNISDDEANSGGLKRSRSPDSDESYEKRLKYDEMSDDSETDSKPKIQFRKIAPKPSSVSTPIQVIKNGIGKNTPLPQNILIPDANGVVRINQKQLPSLSTGVYIMSKTAGIIKLDSNTSKVATSGGQTIVKVAPKIGQTQIKIMKKDGTTAQQVVQMTPKSIQMPQKAMKTHLARAKKLVTELKPTTPLIKKTPDIIRKSTILGRSDSDKKPTVVKKIPELLSRQATKIITMPKPKESEAPKDEESDDGLEELPFPDEIKVPEPEEEDEDEFVLDPTTGKIAGVEYPDPEPEPEPIEEAKSDSSLDNIVKLAAADITEEDLKNEPQDSIDVEMHNIVDHDGDIKNIKTEPQAVPEKRYVASSTPMKPVVKMSVTPRKVVANPTSILNKALTGPQVIRRTVVGSNPKVQQRILNQSIARGTHVVSPVVRQINTYVRTKPTPPKPRFNIASEPTKFIRPNQNLSPKQIYSYSRPIIQNSSSSSRRIGNTTIRSSSSPAINSQPKMQTKIVRTSSGLVQRILSPVKKDPPVVVRSQPERIDRKVAAQKPKTVISMPSLMMDDDLLTPKTAKLKPAPTTVQTILSTEEPENEELEENHAQSVSEQSVSQSSVGTSQDSEESTSNMTATSAMASLTPDISSFTLADNENPIFITGDDGTVYQVAGQNEQGQTILLTQGSDGQQQCLLVTNEIAEAMETSATEETSVQPEIPVPEITSDVTEPLSIKTDPTENNDQVVAQVVRAEPPSPGGTHKVVVMLPDGNLMVTQVSPEEYASLELE